MGTEIPFSFVLPFKLKTPRETTTPRYSQALKNVHDHNLSLSLMYVRNWFKQFADESRIGASLADVGRMLRSGNFGLVVLTLPGVWVKLKKQDGCFERFHSVIKTAGMSNLSEIIHNGHLVKLEVTSEVDLSFFENLPSMKLTESKEIAISGGKLYDGPMKFILSTARRFPPAYVQLASEMQIPDAASEVLKSISAVFKIVKIRVFGLLHNETVEKGFKKLFDYDAIVDQMDLDSDFQSHFPMSSPLLQIAWSRLHRKQRVILTKLVQVISDAPFRYAYAYNRILKESSEFLVNQAPVAILGPHGAGKSSLFNSNEVSFLSVNMRIVEFDDYLRFCFGYDMRSLTNLIFDSPERIASAWMAVAVNPSELIFKLISKIQVVITEGSSDELIEFFSYLIPYESLQLITLRAYVALSFSSEMFLMLANSYWQVQAMPFGVISADVLDYEQPYFIDGMPSERVRVLNTIQSTYSSPISTYPWVVIRSFLRATAT